MPKASAPKLHQRNMAKGKSKNPPAQVSAPEGLVSRFLWSQLRRIGLGHPLGRDPSRKIDTAITNSDYKFHSSASVVASSSTTSSTICALRSAARRRAVTASLLTLRGMPLVT